MARQLDRQLDLFGARMWSGERRYEAASALADSLAELMGEKVRLVVHDNRCTMVSFRRRDGLLHYRLHHMFLDAPHDVVHALATFARPPRGAARHRAAGSQIDAYVRQHRARIGAPRPARLHARGRVHDLQVLFDELNAEHFHGLVEASIGWGPNRGGAARRRTIKTGVYVQDARLIRIHPALDRAEVPEFYVRAVVFHEMLHQVVPAVERGGRRIVHGAEFRRRERAYPDHARARQWEERNLTLLLSHR